MKVLQVALICMIRTTLLRISSKMSLKMMTLNKKTIMILRMQSHKDLIKVILTLLSKR